MRPAGSDARQRATSDVGADKSTSPVAAASTATGAGGAASVPRTLAEVRAEAIDHHRNGRIDQALDLYYKVLSARPGDTGVWCNAGAALRQKKQYQSAVNCYRHALAIKPDDLAVLGNLANALKDLHRFDEAIELHARVVDRRPDDPQALMNFACALREAGRFAEALAQLDHAKAIEPENAGVEWERAQNLLYLGRYSEGWRAYEARWRTGELPQHAWKRPQWRGEPIDGKHIVLHSEQGYGDTILAARYVAMVKERVGAKGRVTLLCKPELHRLLSEAGADQLSAPTQLPVSFDLHCPLMSLMGCFDTQPGTVPAPARLHIPEESRQKFIDLRSRYSGILKVGIVWSGSVTFKNNANRALTLDAFLPLAEMPGVRLFSLQKGPCLPQLHANGADLYIEDIGSRCEDFADTAAAIENLDAIVMTDSSVAHLAASLGKPVINLLQRVPYWLYALDEETTPWYSSMKLVRQQRAGEWSGMLSRVEALLGSLAAS